MNVDIVKQVDDLQKEIFHLSLKINRFSELCGHSVTFGLYPATLFVTISANGREGVREKSVMDSWINLSNLTMAKEKLLAVKAKMQQILGARETVEERYQKRIERKQSLLASDPHSGGTMKEQRGVNLL